jgi:hypothetical protein
MNWILVSALLLFATALMWAALRRLKQFRLKERYALIFLLSSVPFLALAVNPDLIRLAAVQLGIDYRTLQLMAVTAFLVFVVIELLTIVSVQERRITRLAQQVAMLDQWQRAQRNEPTRSEAGSASRYEALHRRAAEQSRTPTAVKLAALDSDEGPSKEYASQQWAATDETIEARE